MTTLFKNHRQSTFAKLANYDHTLVQVLKKRQCSDFTKPIEVWITLEISNTGSMARALLSAGGPNVRSLATSRSILCASVHRQGVTGKQCAFP